MKELKLTSDNYGDVMFDLAKLDMTKQYKLVVTDWVDGRGLSANAQMHVFFGQIAKHQSVPMLTAKSRCKIDFGLPIILGKGNNHSKVVDYILSKSGFYQMSREQQERFITAIAVTSEFTGKESKRFMDDIIYYWNDNGLAISYQEQVK